MISDFKELNKLFEEIDHAIGEDVHFFIIGGAMLLYHGMKTATKDIDIIVATKKEFMEIQKALDRLDFKAKIPSDEYDRIDLDQILVRDDFRIDLFQNSVCRGFSLTEPMKKRADKIIKLNHLSVFLVSIEDVFLFKTFTEREGDIEDCIALSKRGMDWQAILDELKNQIENSGKKVWIT